VARAGGRRNFRVRNVGDNGIDYSCTGTRACAVRNQFDPLLTCRTCGRICGTAKALADHRKDTHGRDGRRNATPCPYQRSTDCSGFIRLFLDSRLFYSGADYGPVWGCLECRAWVGCHDGTTRAKGTVADRHLRDLRKVAHAEFDPIWRREYVTRQQAYALLAERLGIPRETCHIGHFDLEMCERTIAVCQVLGPELAAKAKARAA